MDLSKAKERPLTQALIREINVRINHMVWRLCRLAQFRIAAFSAGVKN